MALLPVIKDHKRGDWWNGATFSYEQETSEGLVGVDLTGAVIIAEFKATKGANVDFTYSTEDGSITILPMEPWKFKFKRGIIDVAPNTYYFDIQLRYNDIDGDPIVETIITDSWTITSDITENGI